MNIKLIVRETLNRFLFHSLGIFLLTNFIFTTVWGQNPQLHQWIIPPYDIRFGSSGSPTAWYNSVLPNPPSYPYSNMSDPQGNYFFFVHGNEIYTASNTTGNPDVTINTNYTWGMPEICIVPVPGSCELFYIIAGNNTSNSTTIHAPHPKYVTYNSSTVTLVNPSAPSPEDLTSSQALDDVHTNTMLLAVSKIRPSTQIRYLFVCDNGHLYRYTIDATGIGSGQQVASLTQGFNSGSKLGEMELYENNDGSYMVAVTQFSSVGVYYFDNQDNLTNSIVVPFSTVAQEYGNGLEFSPNGHYLYFTKVQSPYIGYIDVQATNPVPVALGVSNAVDFNTSYIEIGYDGKLYFANGNRLASVGNPNTPTTPGWTNSVVSVDQNSTPLSMGSYFLPDQIDGEVYWQGASGISPECCAFASSWNTTHSQPDYTAPTGTHTWTASSNPVNGGTGATARIEGVLTIPTGADITITDMTFEFGLNGYVVVERGAKLTLNGTKFTGNNTCQQMWLGVSVLGAGQNGSSALASNGQFIMQESAANRPIVEEAYNGVVNCSFDGDMNYTGGYIECHRAIFQDNFFSVSLNSHNYNASTAHTYHCLVENCDFRTYNGLWYPHAGIPPKTFISLYDVGGTDDIEINSTGTNRNTFSYGYVGIYCTDTRNIDIDKATFTGCTTGIISTQTIATATNHDFTNLTFNGFSKAIGLYHTTDDKISSCLFNPNQDVQSSNFEAISMEGANNFNIFDNQFFRVKSGVKITNSGPQGGWVFDNIFGDLTTGNGCWRGVQSFGNNSSVNVKCNQFYNNQPASDFSTAWFVLNDFDDQGILGNQPWDPAGNVFQRAAGRKDIFAYAGIASTNCPGNNFCYYHHNAVQYIPLIYLQTGGNVSVVNTSVVYDNNSSCSQERKSVMALAGNDPDVAKTLIDEQENPVTQQLWINELVAWYLINKQNDDAIAYLQQFNKKATDEMLFNIYMTNGVYSAAEDILSDRCAQSDDESVAWCNLNTIILGWTENNETPFDMTEAEHTTITDVAGTKTSSAAQAKSILALVFKDTIIDPPVDTLNRMEMPVTDSENSFSLYPNPACDGKTVITCTGNNMQNTQVTIAIQDAAGRKFSEKQYTIDSHSQIVLPLGTLSSGVYLLELKLKDSPPEYLKMIVENKK